MLWLWESEVGGWERREDRTGESENRGIGTLFTVSPFRCFTVSPTPVSSPYFPFQFGLRFSAKAFGPSLTSSEYIICCRAEYERDSARSKGRPKPIIAHCLVARTESGAHSRISFAQRSAVGSRSLSGTISLTMPKLKASGAVICLPVSM